MRRIVFVCTGNTCRSPMAEAIAKHIFKEKNLDIVVTSRGLSVFNQLPMSPNSAKVLKNHNIPFGEHTSRALISDDVAGANLILTMTQRLKDALLTVLPNLTDKIYTLYEYVEGDSKDIIDPFGKDYSTYEKCFNELYDLINKLDLKRRTT